jgi:WD40 repeat protein
MIGGPLTLGETPDEKNRFRSLASFKPRPGHPDEIAVTAPDGSIQLWSLSQRRRLKTIRIITGATESAFAFDSTGTNLIAFTNNHTLEQWNVDSGTQVHTPWPAPNTSEVDGFTADGYLLTLDFSGPTLQFWDLKQGLISGTMPLGGYALSSTTLEEPIIREYSFDELGLMPVNLSMTDRIWSERLCAISGRDFTNHERTVLPPGTSAEIPCTS